MNNIVKTLMLKSFSVAAIAFLSLMMTATAHAEFKFESIDNNFPDEITAATEEGKNLVVMFQQTGCPYCAKMHARVFPESSVDEFYTKNFVMMMSNIRSGLPVVSPDGKEMTEKQLAHTFRVRATPVFMFFDKKGKIVLRVTGFMNAERFNKAGQYVLDGIYKTKVSFYRYLLKK